MIIAIRFSVAGIVSVVARTTLILASFPVILQDLPTSLTKISTAIAPGDGFLLFATGWKLQGSCPGHVVLLAALQSRAIHAPHEL